MWLRDNDQEQLLTDLTAPTQLHLCHCHNISYAGVSFRRLTLDLIESERCPRYTHYNTCNFHTDNAKACLLFLSLSISHMLSFFLSLCLSLSLFLTLCPSSSCSVHIGDVIVTINGVSIEGSSHQGIVDLIRESNNLLR